jgi:hypothetical protein
VEEGIIWQKCPFVYPVVAKRIEFIAPRHRQTVGSGHFAARFPDLTSNDFLNIPGKTNRLRSAKAKWRSSFLAQTTTGLI